MRTKDKILIYLETDQMLESMLDAIRFVGEESFVQLHLVAVDVTESVAQMFLMPVDCLLV